MSFVPCKLWVDTHGAIICHAATGATTMDAAERLHRKISKGTLKTVTVKKRQAALV